MYWFDNIFGCITTNIGDNKTAKQLAKFKNQITFQNVFVRLVNKALARYDIEGYPDTVNGRVLRMSLLYHGSVGFFEKDGAVLALPALPNANVTLYGDFKSMFVYGRNGFNAEIPLYVPGGDDSTLVNKPIGGVSLSKTPRGIWLRENPQVFPFILNCIDYAEKIADTYRTLDVLRHHLKRPYIITADEQLIATIKKAFEVINENQPIVVSSGVFTPDRIQVLPLTVTPDTLKIVSDLIDWYYNDFDNLCGKNSNANPDKKERLLVDEVNANNETTESGQADFLDYLQEQLDFVNEKLGTSMTVVELGKEEEQDDDVSGMDPDAGSGEMADTANGD